jgi:cell division septation protein DedD
MRNLFLALLLANLAFAAWHAWLATPPASTRGVAPDLPRLTLVSELPEGLRSAGAVLETDSRAGVGLPAAPAADSVAPNAPETTTPEAAAAAADPSGESPPAAPTASEDAPPVGAASATARCTSVGPFRELSQAATAAANLRAAGYQPVQRVAEGDIWIGYWVYIEAIPTVDEANAVLAKVRAQGITDSYVIPNSDSGNLVSLGVFSEISGVSRRRDEVRALGFEPQVVDRTRRATVYWIDVQLTEGQSLDFDSLQTPGRIVRLEQRSCESALP